MSSSLAYYNECDPAAAQWLRNLIEAGLIAPGIVDDRSIEDVTPADLMGFAQVHLFAGIGGWSLALRQAGWPDDKPVWTGSCPCQPFSAAGAGNGFDDERHLWPAMFWLARQHHPDVIFGEQVDSKAALAWLDLVFTDLEGEGYTCGATDFCAASVGAPHRRQRLYWVADALCGRTGNAPRQGLGTQAAPNGKHGDLSGQGCRLRVDGATRSMVLSDYKRLPPGRRPEPRQSGRTNTGEPTRSVGNPESNDQRRASEPGSDGQWLAVGGSGCACGLGNPEHQGPSTELQPGGTQETGRVLELEGPGPVNGFWRDAEWLPCTDGKARPTQPGVTPLAHGVPGRVVKLRAFGNAICIAQAAEYIEAYRVIRLA